MTVARTITRFVVPTALAGAVALGAAPAHADGMDGGSGGGAFTVSVDAQVTGDAGDPLTGGGGTAISISVPPTCWWEPFDTENLGYYDIAADDPKAMTKWFKEITKDTTISFVPSRLTHPSEQYLKAHEGADWSWYTLSSADGVNCADEGFTPSGGQGPDGWASGSGAIPISYAAFPQGQDTPELVDVADVVDAVWDQATAQVAAPALDRNPQIDAAGGATLVNLATWFWVQNVQEALAEDGEIHLEVSLPGVTPLVQAQLDATTDGVQITSPAGATSCTVDAATTEWSSGTAEESACTIPFSRANTAGWPVTASVSWTGTWQGVDADGPDGGALAPINQAGTIDVPVAESEALVNDVD